jgi:hypothetical protein
VFCYTATDVSYIVQTNISLQRASLLQSADMLHIWGGSVSSQPTTVFLFFYLDFTFYAT